jgi:VIT1/CCC1 family predicted Fe2+/Mn2+ transporter
MSMAAGEYVSVSSQSDTERADLAIERAELAADPEIERDELAAIYVVRGLDATLARQVADQLMAYDALAAHARDELGFSHVITARPVQAAFASAGSFAVGAAMPLLTAAVAPERGMVLVIAATSLLFLIGLGGVAARAGGAPVWRGALRVAFWGALAMAFTALVGWAFGVSMA